MGNESVPAPRIVGTMEPPAGATEAPPAAWNQLLRGSLHWLRHIVALAVVAMPLIVGGCATSTSETPTPTPRETVTSIGTTIKNADLDPSIQAAVQAGQFPRFDKDWLTHFNNFDNDFDYGLQGAASHQQLGVIVKDKHGNVYTSHSQIVGGKNHAVDFYVPVIDGGKIDLKIADVRTSDDVLLLMPINPNDFTQGFYALAINVNAIRIADEVEGSPTNPYLYSGVDNSKIASHAGEFMVIGFRNADLSGEYPNNIALYDWLMGGKKGTPPASVGQFTSTGDLLFKNTVPPVILAPEYAAIQVDN